MFNWLKRYISEWGSRPWENPAIPVEDALDYTTLGQLAASGKPIGVNALLSIPICYRCIDLISSLIAQCYLCVQQEQEDGGVKEFTDHPAWWFFTRQPNEKIDNIQWQQTSIADYLIHGESFDYVERKGADPINVYHLSPENTRIKPDSKFLLYETQTETGWEQFLPENTIHVRGLYGKSVLQLLADTFGLNLALRDHASWNLKNHCLPKVFIEMPPGVGIEPDKEDRSKQRERIRKEHGGRNAYGTGFLVNGSKVQSVSIDNVSSQYIETSTKEDRQLAALFGVPTRFLALPDSVSYNSLEQDILWFLTMTISPIMRKFEAQYEMRLLSYKQQLSGKVFIAYDKSDLLNADIFKAQAADTALVTAGLMLPNEFRYKYKQSSLEDGDKLRLPTTIQPETPPPGEAPGAVQGEAPGAAPAHPMSSVEDLIAEYSIRCGGVGSGVPGPCPTVSSWAAKAASIPKAILDKAKTKVKEKYAQLEKRYGKKYALAIISAAVVGIPIPLPGASLLLASPLIAVAELHRALS